MVPKNRHLKLIAYAVLGIFSLAIVYLTDQQGISRIIDSALYDTWHQIYGKRYTPQHTLLAPVDDETLSHYPDDPLAFWTPQFAQAINTLSAAGAKVIGLDFLISITADKWMQKYGIYSDSIDHQFGIPLRSQIASGKVILIAANPSGHGLLLPSPELLLSVPDFDVQSHIGIADLPSDPDTTVRRFNSITQQQAESPDAGFPIYSFATLLASRQKEDVLSPDHSSEQNILFAGPPGTFERIPFHFLLQPDALTLPEVQALKDKIVIIGGEFQGMNDYHDTPYSGGLLSGHNPQYMTGMEIHANIIETLLTPESMVSLQGTPLFFYRVTMILITLLLFINLTKTGAILALTTATLLLPGIAYSAFTQGTIITVASLYFGVLTAYAGCLLIKYAYEEREKNRISQAFGRYIAPEVVEEIVASGESPSLGGSRQSVTILFSDIRNFTQLSERLEPEEVVEILNTYFEQVSQAVLNEGGTIDKYIGDAIMVQFGAPLTYTDHADRAIRSALKISKIADKFAQWLTTEYPGRGLPAFAIGIGINSGEVIVGNIGCSSHFDYTAIGDAVNTAARIESETKAFQTKILASQSTVAQCQSEVSIGRHQAVQVKGKEKPVEVFEILDLK